MNTNYAGHFLYAFRWGFPCLCSIQSYRCRIIYSQLISSWHQFQFSTLSQGGGSLPVLSLVSVCGLIRQMLMYPMSVMLCKLWPVVSSSTSHLLDTCWFLTSPHYLLATKWFLGTQSSERWLGSRSATSVFHDPKMSSHSMRCAIDNLYNPDLTIHTPHTVNIVKTENRKK